jgi:hypothetical protein
LDAAQVGGVLDDGELPVDEQPRRHLDRRVLRGEGLVQRQEPLPIFGCPPISQIPLPIELRSPKVKAMRDLVAGDEANAAQVGRRIGFIIEEGRLQDAGREEHRVLGRDIERVDILDRSGPLAAIDRSAGLGKVLGQPHGQRAAQ